MIALVLEVLPLWVTRRMLDVYGVPGIIDDLDNLVDIGGAPVGSRVTKRTGRRRVTILDMFE